MWKQEDKTGGIADYHIQGEIGHGSSGVCFKATYKPNSMVYAIKKISIATIKSNTLNQALKQVQLLKGLHHPNIIKYHDSFFDESYLYIVMEYAEKGDLHTVLKRRKIKQQFFSQAELWEMARQLLDALKYLESRKIVHRDFKTLNILIDHNNNLLVGDLGVSKILKNDMELYSRVGTPLYLAPEIIKHEKYDYKADIWGFGCVMYLAAALCHPFEATNIITLAQNILHKQPKQIPNLTNQFNDMLKQVLQKNPSKRPHAKDLLNKYFSISVMKFRKGILKVKLLKTSKTENQNEQQQLHQEQIIDKNVEKEKDKDKEKEKDKDKDKDKEKDKEKEKDKNREKQKQKDREKQKNICNVLFEQSNHFVGSRCHPVWDSQHRNEKQNDKLKKGVLRSNFYQHQDQTIKEKHDNATKCNNGQQKTRIKKSLNSTKQKILRSKANWVSEPTAVVDQTSQIEQLKPNQYESQNNYNYDNEDENDSENHKIRQKLQLQLQLQTSHKRILTSHRHNRNQSSTTPSQPPTQPHPTRIPSYFLNHRAQSIDLNSHVNLNLHPIKQRVQTDNLKVCSSSCPRFDRYKCVVSNINRIFFQSEPDRGGKKDNNNTACRPKTCIRSRQMTSNELRFIKRKRHIVSEDSTLNTRTQILQKPEMIII